MVLIRPRIKIGFLRSMANLDSQDGENQLCDACADLEIENLLTQEMIDDDRELGRRDYHDIREKKCCPLCRLVMSALDRRVDVDLGQLMPSTQVHYQIKRFGEFQSVDHPGLVVVNRLALSILDATSADNPLYQMFIQLYSGDYTDKKERLHDSIMRGRSTSNAIDMGLVKIWLDSCQAQHDSKCSSSELSAESGWSSFKLIDKASCSCKATLSIRGIELCPGCKRGPAIGVDGEYVLTAYQTRRAE